MSDVIWAPDSAARESSAISRFARFAEQRYGISLPEYADLHRWSVEQLDAFWRSIWDFFSIDSTTEPTIGLANATMPGATWFPGTRLNYAHHALRPGEPDSVAIIGAGEPGVRSVALTRGELRRQVAALSHTLSRNGIRPGDRVVGYLPNISEAVVAFLATASVGAIWACCGQDYAPAAAIARLGQLEPAALITADGYQFNGQPMSRRDAVDELRANLPTLRVTIAASRLGTDIPDALGWDEATRGDVPWTPVRVPFDHPLWVVFSSGSTGIPKGIVHSHGGVLLEQFKTEALHFDLSPADTFFWFTTLSWMLWNTLVGGLLVGCRIVCYDGSPSFPDGEALWDIADRVGATVLGVSPGYLAASQNRHASLRSDRALTALKSVGVTGSVLPAHTASWLASQLGPTVRIASVSGGTDVVTGLVGSAPILPSRSGEISAACLGVAVAAYDETGQPATGVEGEMVVTEPMPSMPIGFWNDQDGQRYRDTYFTMFEGVWRQGDWITKNERGGVVIHGRSDSTLNRHGVRMGSADVCDVVEQFPEIEESLVLGVEGADGSYWMPLFVVLEESLRLDDELRTRIAQTVRQKASPRHVPDDIIQAPGIPHTRTGKKLEVPLKRIMQGADSTAVVDASAVDHPELLEWFSRIAQERAELSATTAASWRLTEAKPAPSVLWEAYRARRNP